MIEASSIGVSKVDSRINKVGENTIPEIPYFKNIVKR